MSARTQQSITGQDIIASFAGEPLRNPERSYRFAGFGMRRWEVPHQQVHELLALGLLASSLRQMIYTNCEQNKGFGDTLPNLSSDLSTKCLAKLDEVLTDFLLSQSRAADFSRELRAEIRVLADGMLKENEAKPDLGALKARVKTFYEQSFKSTGAVSIFQAFQRNQFNQTEDAIVRLNQALTSFWLDAASPVALAHISELIDSFSATLRAKLQDQDRLDFPGRSYASPKFPRHANLNGPRLPRSRPSWASAAPFS